MSILSDIAEIKKQIANLNAMTLDDINKIVESKIKDIQNELNKLNDVVGLTEPVEPPPAQPQ